MKSFFDFTNVLSKTCAILVHHAFTIYNRLFSYLDNIKKRLKHKTISWKKRMLQALRAAKEKLSKYYWTID
jgi:hypothetical protein